MTATARRDDIHRHIVGTTAPAAVAAERTLLGIVLANGEALDLIEGLQPAHFYEPLHGRLWSAILARHAAGSFAEPDLLDGQFLQDEAYRNMGGLLGLQALMDTAPGPSKTAAYVAEIKDAASRRALITLAKDVQEKAEDREAGPVAELLAEFEHGAAEIAKTADLADAWEAPSEMIDGAVMRARERKGVIEFPVGIPDVDRLLGGLHRGEVTVLAARPGVGKTVGAQVIAKTSARAGLATPFFALEMGSDPMALRLACDLAYDRERPSYMGQTSNITLERINRDELSDDEWERIDIAKREVARWPLRFDTRAGHTMARMEALARRFYRRAERQGLKRGPLIIDHMGKARAAKGGRGDLRIETIEVSRDASEMAKRLDVPVLLLCQLSRAIESRQDKQPNLADLREAGQIEEDARQVIFLHRPEYHLREPAGGEDFNAKAERETKLDAARNKLFWIVAKNSHGPPGTALTFCEISASAVREWRS